MGDAQRAQRLSTLLSSITFSSTSHRGFTCYTGIYKGTSISIISIGMGYPMMDMMVREVKAIQSGPTVFIRFGSCGGVGSDVDVGSVVVADAALMVTRNFDVFIPHEKTSLYHVGKPIVATKTLTSLLQQNLQEHLGSDRVAHGLNGTADSFYSSQGNCFRFSKN